MMAGKMMAGVRRTPPLLKLELEETVRALRKEEEEVVMAPAGSVEKRDTLPGSVLREEVETTSAGTAVRLVCSELPALDLINFVQSKAIKHFTCAGKYFFNFSCF